MAIATDRDGNLTLVKRASAKTANSHSCRSTPSSRTRRKRRTPQNSGKNETIFEQNKEKRLHNDAPTHLEAANALADKAYYATPWTEPVNEPLSRASNGT